MTILSDRLTTLEARLDRVEFTQWRLGNELDWLWATLFGNHLTHEEFLAVLLGVDLDLEGGDEL